MKAGVFYKSHDIRVEEVEGPKIQNPTDAVVKVTYSCICGSDLWWYRGISEKDSKTRTGHEFMGIVESVGKGVKKLKVGDLVIAPFKWADGTCPECVVGMFSYCRHGGGWGGELGGGQGEKVRVPFADASLFKVPSAKARNQSLMPSLLTLSDVMCTGFHAAVCAGVEKGKTVAVIGDGAVGLCAVLSAKYLGAKKIILLSSHEDRAKVGKKFGADEIIKTRGDAATEELKKLTGDLGADCVLECVGSKESWQQAVQLVRVGGMIGFVGIPHEAADLKVRDLLDRNFGVMGGIAPAAAYIPQLMKAVLAGKINPGLVFTKTISLDQLKEGYDAMDQRQAIKVMIKV